MAGRRATTDRARGFTLVELVITLILIAIIAGVLAPFIYQAVNGFVDTRARAELVGKGRLALERLARELRQADPGTVSVQADRLAFTRVTVDFSAPDNDIGVIYKGGVPHKTYRKCTPVSLQYSGGTVLWTEGGVQGRWLDGVTDLRFAANPGNVRRPVVVAVSLTLEEDGSRIDLHREVQIRNTQGDACP